MNELSRSSNVRPSHLIQRDAVARGHNDVDASPNVDSSLPNNSPSFNFDSTSLTDNVDYSHLLYRHTAMASERSPLLAKQPPLSRPSSISSRSSRSPPPSWRTTLTLLAALGNCLWAGSVLIFALYAPQFHSALGYRQMQINAVSIATELGMYVPVPVFGYICDAYGPARLSALSALFFGPGYMLAALAYAHALDFRVMVAAFGLIGMGTSAMYFAGVTTCAKTATGRRGLALALPIAAFGLSALWQAQLVSRVFAGPGGLRVTQVFMFFAASLTAVGLLGAAGLRVDKTAEEDEEAAEQDNEKHWVNADTRAFLRDRHMWWFAAGVFLVTGPGEAFINNVSSPPGG